MGNKANKGSAIRDLSAKEIDVLQRNTGLSRTQILDWHRQFLSEFPDGYMDKKEFINIYTKTYSSGNAAKFAQFAFKAFDDDNSGRISFPGKKDS